MNNAKNTTLFPYLERLLEGEAVEWKTLGEVCDYEQPTAYLVRSTDYSRPISDSGAYRWKNFHPRVHQ